MFPCFSNDLFQLVGVVRIQLDFQRAEPLEGKVKLVKVRLNSLALFLSLHMFIMSMRIRNLKALAINVPRLKLCDGPWIGWGHLPHLPLDPVVLHLPSLPCLKSIIVENGSQYLSDAFNGIEIVDLIQRHGQIAFFHTVVYFPVVIIHVKVELFIEILNALNTEFVIWACIFRLFAKFLEICLFIVDFPI